MAFDTSQPAYVDLRSLITEHTKQFVVWTGSGLSIPAGLPSWGDLRSALENDLQKKANTLDEEGAASLRKYLENAKNTSNPWDAFKILKTGLGEASFESVIRSKMAPAQQAEPPQTYCSIWELEPRGIMNLNLDRLATRAFAATYSGSRTLTEFNSKSVGDHIQVLQNPHVSFIYNAHGADDETRSWVLTRDDLNRLTGDNAYKSFIRSLLSNATSVFIGMSADDEAAGGHLERLVRDRVSTGPHYWITDRTDLTTDTWAESNSIRLIRYRNQDGAHSELGELFLDLSQYLPTVEPIPADPVVPKKLISVADLPALDDLKREEPEMIRLFLNQHAQALLASGSPESVAEFFQFLDDYDSAVWIAWYVKPSGKDVILGYNIERVQARGAFGKVYKGVDANGRPVAVKILLEDIRGDEDALMSFRRGVASMKILKNRGIHGAVEYYDAAEIPAMVVMEWVDGLNLQEAVQAKKVHSWEEILKVAVWLSKILRDAHGLPERVLHRDLRPPNIMLDGIHDKKDWTVRVLDFDLSWHRGAYDRSVVHVPGTSGYLAPEQIQRLDGVSTRHSAVDSFGLGMTLYFMLTGRDPLPDQQRHSDWEESVYDASTFPPEPEWYSLPSRFARLVISMTRDRQSDRPDMTSVNMELGRLRDQLSQRFTRRNNLDLIVEELAARSETLARYEWSEERQAAQVRNATNTELELRANESRGWIELTVRLTGNVTQKRVSIARDEARSILNQAGWRFESHPLQNSLTIKAYLKADCSEVKLLEASRIIDKVVRILSQ